MQSWQIVLDNLRMPFQSDMETKEQNQDQRKLKKQMENLLNRHGYFLIRVIGHGSEGNVWLVFHQATGALRAAKAISAASQKVALLRVWASMEHFGLVKIYDLLQDQNVCCVIMEYLEGESLKEHIHTAGEKKKRISGRKAAKWGIELCDALSHLHTLQPAVIYQDLKPSNVILTKEGRLKIIDPDGAGFQDEAFCVMGTRGFMAPEQECQGSIDDRTDIYALGRTLQWILENKQRKRKKSHSPLWQILEKCTRQDPDERFQNVAELKKAFRDYLHITRRMSLFAALMIIIVSVLGSIEISIQDEQKREQLYQTYLSQKDISDYKSAIFLFPGREEGYQQFLKSIMEDGQMDRQEHQELTSLLFYTEGDLQKNRRAYHRFAGQLAVIYHFFYMENGGEQYAENWIEKFVETKDGVPKDNVPWKETMDERMEQQKKEEEEIQQMMDLYEEWFQKKEISEEEVQEWKRGVSDRKETEE